MPKRKRATRSMPASNTLSIAMPKPRNVVLQAIALGKVKMGTAKHEKSAGALRRAQAMALAKSAAQSQEP